MEIGRHRRDPVDREVEVGDGVAELSHERRDEAADAGVDVEPEFSLTGQRREIVNGVDDAVRELRRRAGQHDRVRVDRFVHGPDVGAEVAADRHPADTHAEKVTGLGEGGMGAVGRDNHRVAHFRAERAYVIARRLDRHEDALGASGGDVAAGLVSCVQQTERPRDDVVLEPFQARKALGPSAFSEK